MEDLTPQAIVAYLDKYIVGQQEAKRAVAVALRNRLRRRRLPSEISREITPKNILMIGPTGVGKTELARRVAGLIDAPFIKVEATKFTEVGYVGRDVESIIQDLVENSVSMVHEEKLKEVESEAERMAMERILNYLCQQHLASGKRVAAKGQARGKGNSSTITVAGGLQGASAEVAKEDGTNQVIGAGPRRAGEKSSSRRERERFAALLSDKQLEDQIIEIEVGSESDGFDSVLEFSAGMSREEMNETFSEFMDSYSSISTRRRSRKVSVREARRILTREEANKLIDFDQVIDSAVQRVEETAVVFIDELDKVAGPKIDVGADVSGEGVQRDLLPIVEGTTVMTRYGPIKTDHILFIAAGTFFHSKPSDLIPEIQGRFPLRVELQPLSQKDFETILSQPVNALIKQYSALLETEGVELVYTPDGIAEMARVAVLMNDRLENIGARRLHTIVERVLEEVSFSASERKGEKIVIDRDFVAARLSDVIKDEDLSRYIL